MDDLDRNLGTLKLAIFLAVTLLMNSENNAVGTELHCRKT